MPHTHAIQRRGIGAHSDHQRPSGRHGGPSVRPSLRSRALTSESYIVNRPYQQALRMGRRAISRQGLEIVRECDIALRLGQAKPCKLLYVTDPDLLLHAISADVSAALWLPLPVVIAEEANATHILFPSEAIVRDRASLLGVEESVKKLYRSLSAAFQAIGVQDSENDSSG